MLFRGCFALLLAVGLVLAPRPSAAADRDDGDALVAQFATLLLKVCSVDSLGASEGARALEAMGATPTGPGRRPTTRHFLLDTGTPAGMAAVSLEGTYCIASIKAGALDLPALARALEARLAPLGAMRADGASGAVRPPDVLLAEWALEAPRDGVTFTVRVVLSTSTLDSGTRVVAFSRVAVLPGPVPPPPAEPKTLEMPAAGVSPTP